MASPQTPFEIRQRFNSALTPIEQRVLEICIRAAEEDRELDSIEAMTAAIGATGVSTVPGIMKRLEAKGYITRTVYQRGRRVCVSATGKCTLPPRNTAPHWRSRPGNVPTVAIQQLRERCPTVLEIADRAAKAEGCDVPTMLAHFTYIGAQEYLAEKERGE